MTAATTALPAFLKRMRADLADLLPDATVCIGHDLSKSTADAVMLLVEDPLSETALANASSSLGWATTGIAADVQEDGTVTCAIALLDGGADPVVVIDRATERLAVIEGWARSSDGASLGIGVLQWALISGIRWAPFQSNKGIELLVTFDVSFSAYLNG